MSEFFTITTNKETAIDIEQQCKFEERTGHRSYELGEIMHEENYSVVQIKAKNGKIKPEELVFLGYFAAKNAVCSTTV